jgi:putative SOS response-associated peptidase YedK
MECETTNDLFAFVTTEPNKVEGAIHPKNIPVFLMNEEIDLWMAALAEEALKLRRPLADDALCNRCQRREKDEGGMAA